MVVDLSFFKNRTVLITGHTGFKGTWLCKILINAGAKVIGYSLEAPTNPSLYEITNIKDKMYSVIGDIRNLNDLSKVFDETQPEIVIHLAAQPIVLESYHNPVYTYETNVIGTVNLLECVRKNICVKSVLNVTTDKVYKNNEWEWGYREEDSLNGFDPYSNSKSCSELVTSSYCNSFFRDREIAISTARAGNVIGGGDFAENRIIPDCIRAASKRENIIVRNPSSIRPYQHVLEALYAYLLIVQSQYKDRSYQGTYNVGPDECDCITTGDLVEAFCLKWGNDIRWMNKSVEGPHEAGYLKLDCSKIKAKLGWRPIWHIEEAIEKTIEWSKCYLEGKNINQCMDDQIKQFFEKRL